MNSLFSTQIGRLAYLGRRVLVFVVQLFGVLLFALIVKTDPQSSGVPYLAFALSFLVILPALYYDIRFAVLARMESIGIPTGYGFLLLIPSLMYFLYYFVTTTLSPMAALLPWILVPLGFFPLLFALALFLLPEDAWRSGNVIQAILHDYEAGESEIVVRLLPFVAALVIIGVLFDFGPFPLPLGSIGGIYHGLNDAQSIDNAQLARQIVRGEGFTTRFLRPYAVTQLQNYKLSQNLLTGQPSDLFPSDQFPSDAPRILPDTYNAPGYPFLLAAWFYVVQPEFNQSPKDMSTQHIYSGEQLIPVLNQIFMLLTAMLVFILSRRLFDDRVAWMALAAFLGTDLVWQYSATGLSTTVLMFLVTVVLFCALEIFRVGEVCLEDEERSFGLAWLWALALALFLALACLTRLHLLVLLAPLLVALILVPRAHPLLLVSIALVVIGLVTPWFWHTYKVSGSPMGSNLPLLVYGDEGYQGNQIFCSTSIPNSVGSFKAMSKKEYLGFRWHFEHAWSLLGSNPMILLFGASLLHPFKRRRTLIFQWLLVGCALVLVMANNLGVNNPAPLDAWNTLVVLFPGMVVIGSAFFFVLFDRLNIEVRLYKTMVVGGTLLLTVMPLALTLTLSTAKFYNFPPYWPPVIKVVGQLAQPNEWVTSDLPWATAWYSDRASLWLPDSLKSFEDFHDNVCPTGVLILTPVTWQQSFANVTTGEDKEWFPIVMRGTPPEGFPLRVHTMTPVNGPDYSVWSDRERWKSNP